jgi:hypothetical protein
VRCIQLNAADIFEIQKLIFYEWKYHIAVERMWNEFIFQEAMHTEQLHFAR